MYSNLLWEKEEEEDEENERDLFLVFRRFEGKNSSPAGNRTPVSRVTGEDTHHYTTEDLAYACKNERYDLRERKVDKKCEKKSCSRAGNRTPAAAVRAPNPNH